MKAEDYLNRLKALYEEYKIFDASKIPLCAAETYVSPFARQALISCYEGKYISGYLYRNKENDFIGSDYLEKNLKLANDLATELFHANYNDFRSLTGMNTVSLVLMSLIEPGSKLLITDPSSGGHGSLPKLCDNRGILYESIPYDYENMQIDYDKLNDILANDSNVSYLFFCQSDIIQPPDLSLINLPANVGIIYDATQTLGLIAGNVLPNPLQMKDDILLIGGTHKTFPGVTCGYIGTNNEKIVKRLSTNVNPDYLRNVQMNNIESVILSMIEMLHLGEEYAANIVRIAHKLGEALTRKGIRVKRVSPSQFTKTHQLFIDLSDLDINATYSKFRYYHVTINKRNTKYVKGFRIGVQEIARYKFDDHIDELAELLRLIIQEPDQEDSIYKIRGNLARLKTDKYVIDDIFMELD